jgi:NAD(P)-dependent dehydrogenase (short-subunit alcohol dehydrogenase family)
MTGSLAGKVALITGATSGIGAACAVEFARCGASIALVGRDAAKGAAVQAEVRAEGRRAELICGNVEDATFCETAVAETLHKFGRLDILVNSAGVNNRGNALELSDAAWHQALAVNVSGTFWMCRAAIHAMRKSGGGAIVNVASDWGLVGGENHVAYCTSKGAVVNMTRALALDHARDGIRVNVICPGEVRTPMLQSGLEHRGYSPEQGFTEMGNGIPIGRISEPMEQARCIRFLASSDASFVTGAVLSVDGGATAR